MVTLSETQIPVRLAEDGETEVMTYRGVDLVVRPADWLERATRTGMPFHQGEQELEYSQRLKPARARGRTGDVGEFWRLYTTEPLVRSAVQNVVSAISAAPWRIEKPNLPTHLEGSQAARDARDRHYAYASRVWARWTATGATRVWSDWISEILQFAMVSGFYLGEITATEERHDFEGITRTFLLPEIPHNIMPMTVDEWVFRGNPDTGMVAIVQETFDQIDNWGDSGEGFKVIPWDKLIHVAYMPAGRGDLEGRSIVRACDQLIRMKQKALQLWALATEVNALGIVTVNQDSARPLTEDAEARIDTELGNRTAEHVTHIIFPPGDHKVQIIRPSEAVPDLGPQIDHLDRQISQALGNAHQLMSMQGTGSYAARTDASSEHRDAYDAIADYPARAAEQLLRRFIMLNFPMDARMGLVFTPNVAHSVVEEKDNQKRAATLAQLVGAGLLTPSPAIEAQLAKENDLAQGITDDEG